MLKFDEVENLESLVERKSINVGGRKMEVLNMLKKGIWSYSELSSEIGISRRNLASILNYLKGDGYLIKRFGDRKDLRLLLVSFKNEKFDYEKKEFKSKIK